MNEEHHNSMWSEISEFLVKCQYTQQKHVKTASKSQLKVFTLNVRSLTKNVCYLREQIDQFDKYDILCLNETNCTRDRLPNGINDLILDGFHEPFLQDPIRSSGRGGGLAIYVHKRVADIDKIELFNPNPDPTNTSGEFQFIKIHQCKGFNSTKIIANIYRSPSRNVESFNNLLESILQKLDRHSRKHMLLSGDFNIDLIKHDNNSSYQNLIDIMSNNGFIQIVSR
ncbi:MAG: endonuclease/exonuclease/phosphatase family protein, partial [Cytophagales bacterium]|nr:endonuclease/exonuclease/phosphatase family protein [Cytophagales bacterium]